MVTKDSYKLRFASETRFLFYPLPVLILFFKAVVLLRRLLEGDPGKSTRNAILSHKEEVQFLLLELSNLTRVMFNLNRTFGIQRKTFGTSYKVYGRVWFFGLKVGLVEGHEKRKKKKKPRATKLTYM